MVNEVKPSIRHLILKEGGSKEDCEDMIQDSIPKLLNMINKPGFRLESSIKTLFYSICKYQWKNRERKKRRYTTVEDHSPQLVSEPEFEYNTDKDQVRELFWNIFNTLPEMCRKILLLNFKEYSIRNIASELNVKPGYVKTRKSNCKQTLIERITTSSEFKQLRKEEVEISNLF